MNYYIVLLQNGTIQINKNKTDKAALPPGARQFVCSSNVTVQDLNVWTAKGYKGFGTIQELE